MSNQPPPTEFSFDLYPGLDSELDDAYRRNVENGTAEPGEIATSGLAAAVQQNLEPQSPKPNLGENVRLHPEVIRASQAWKPYMGELSAVQSSATEMPLHQLIEAGEDLGARLTPEDRPIAESMKLVMIPWQAFRANLNDIPGWLIKLRSNQGITTQEDFFNSHINDAIVEGKEFYRDPDPQTLRGRTGRLRGVKRWISAKEYLDKRIAVDGPWGAMIVQTSDEAGLKDWIGKSPNDLTEDGEAQIEVAGHDVDGLGIFEWLSLTLAEDPSKLSTRDYSWLLANRLDVNGDSCVPCGDFSGGQVRSVLYWADYQHGDVRPRLAVIGKGL